jgi:diadenylate cyclase
MPDLDSQIGQDALLRTTLEAVAPGTELRGAIERILRGRTGALIALGFNSQMESICSGGFELDVPFTATGMRELAKMDGAVVLDTSQRRIVRAAVQLLPDPSIPTAESGTRHRTAERVAKQTGIPVISVSQSMNMAALYIHGIRHVLLDPDELAARTKQALDTLESYRSRLDEVSASLSALEIEDLVSVREAAAVAGRQEMVWRIGTEVSALLAELGTAGRLLRLQFDELIAGISQERRLLVRDYAGPAATDSDQDAQPASTSSATEDAVLAALGKVPAASLIEPEAVAKAMGLLEHGRTADSHISANGWRLLVRVPGVNPGLASAIVRHFGSLQAILGAPLEELIGIGGLTKQRARAVREGISRVAETAALERFP